MKKKLFKLASLATNSLKVASIVCLTLASTMVNAQTTIPVVNGDFSDPVTVKTKGWELIPGWASDAPDTPATDSGIENGQKGYVWSADAPVYNLTDHVIALNETYQLSLTAWSSYNAGNLIATLYYDAGDNIRVVLGTTSVAVVGTTTVTLTAAAIPASVGAKLGIEITCTAGSLYTSGWADFDNVTLSYTTTLGVNDLELGDSSVKIFPNPNNGNFKISHNAVESSINVKIYNILSEEILNQNFDASSKSLEINSGLTPGIYIVKVNDKFSSKLIVK